jgi:hypothetical protein
MNNESFLKTLMQSDKVGALSQIVVLAAIDKYTKEVADTSDAKVMEAFEHSMFHGLSWKHACVEIQEKFRERQTQAELTAKSWADMTAKLWADKRKPPVRSPGPHKPIVANPGDLPNLRKKLESES